MTKGDKETKVLGLLPARFGSKGLPGKNLLRIGGITTTEWAARALAGAESVTHAVCSTDSPEIAEVAMKAGLSVPFLRPKELAKDTTPVIDVILHALQELSDRKGEAYTHVALVQATSPTVTSPDVDSAVKLAIDMKFTTVISGYEAPLEAHPANLFTANDSEVTSWALGPRLPAQRRQDWPTYFVRAGLVYVFQVSELAEGASFYDGKTGVIKIERQRALSIDDAQDFEKARQFLER